MILINAVVTSCLCAQFQLHSDCLVLHTNVYRCFCGRYLGSTESPSNAFLAAFGNDVYLLMLGSSHGHGIIAAFGPTAMLLGKTKYRQYPQAGQEGTTATALLSATGEAATPDPVQQELWANLAA